MNKVILMGRITRDLELKYSGSKEEPIAVLKFTLAVSRKYKKENEVNADFINCTAFNKTAEFISEYFGKGQMIAIIGEIRNNNYIDKNGEKRYVTEVLIEKVEFCGSKNTNSNDTSLDNTPEEFYDIEENVENENLPF